MKFDLVEVFGGAVGSLLFRVFLFISAVWLGTLVAGISLTIAGGISAGNLPDKIGWVLLASPLLLFSQWLFLNVFILMAGFGFFLKTDRDVYLPWLVLAALESLMVMLGYASELPGKWPIRVLAWGLFVIFLGMLATGLWLLRQYFINHWVREIAGVRAEISVRQAHAESRTLERIEASLPPEPPAAVDVPALSKTVPSGSSG